jgi:hypothetical protein
LFVQAVMIESTGTLSFDSREGIQLRFKQLEYL